MRFLHTADLHLGRSFPYASERDRARGRKDRFDTFDAILKLGERRKIDYLFLVGDIFEQDKIEPEEVDGVLARLGDMSFVTLLVLGNHDYKLYDYLIGRLPERVLLFDSGEMTVYSDDRYHVSFYGTSWNRQSYQRILQYEVNGEGDGNHKVLLHHGNWTGGDGYFPVDATILSDFDYIALGHVHKPILYENKLQMCGTPEPLDYTDRGKLGVIIGELGEELTTEYVPVAKRSLRQKSIHVDGEEPLEAVAATLDDKESIYRFYLTGKYDNLVDAQIKRFLDEKQVLYSVEWARDLPAIIEKVYCAHREDALGAFIREARALDRDETTRLRVCDLGIRALLGEDYDS